MIAKVISFTTVHRDQGVANAGPVVCSEQGYSP
jgi:hypothetical protein